MAEALVELANMPGWSHEKKVLLVAMALEGFTRDAMGPAAGDVGSTRGGGSLSRPKELAAP